jgi:hypothetical protein
MSRLSDVIDELKKIVDEYRPPSSFEVRIVEINGNTPGIPGNFPETDHARLQVKLCTPAEYEQRFEELLNRGYSWINVGFRGIHRDFLIIGVELPSLKIPDGSGRWIPRRLYPGHRTSINLSGPCNAVVDRGLNVEWELDIVDGR